MNGGVQRATVRVLLALIVTLTLPANAAQPAARPQRMLLVPGCATIAPGAFYDASAYCLDQDAPAPPQGASMTGVPRGLGRATVVVGAGGMDLQTALARHLVGLESRGPDDYFQVRLRNLTAQTLRICIQTPTVIAADGAYPTDDLVKSYAQIAVAAGQGAGFGAAPGGTANDPEIRAAVQRKIWDVTQREQDEELRAELAPGTLQAAKSPVQGSPATKCPDHPTVMTVCAER